MRPLATAVSALSILMATLCAGDTILVPGEQPTIQAGIDVAADGDIVLVAAGVYTGTGNRNLSFSGKKITVRSEDGAEATLIDCEYTGRGFVFDSGETPDSKLAGFSILNGSVESGRSGGRGGALFISGCSPTITKCDIFDNSADKGGGLFCEYSDTDISVCVIRDNSAAAGGSGGGIETDLYSSALITRCTISGNEADWSGGGLSVRNSSSAVLENCSITDNQSSLDGGGIYCDSNVSLEISTSDIKQNISNCGGGIYCHYGSSLFIEYSTISQNVSYSSGGGIWGSGQSSVTVTDCSIVRNGAYPSGVGGGGGIACWRTVLEMSRCFLVENGTIGNGGAVYCRSYSNPSIVNCTFSDNAADYGGAVYLRDLNSPVIRNSILWNNTGNEIHTYNSSPAVTYSDVREGWPGEGNIDEDPVFVDPLENDYRLAKRSPCIDAGDPLAQPPIGGGARIDMGAHEFDFGWRLSRTNSPR